MTNIDAVREVAFDELTPVKVYLDVITNSQDPNEVRAAGDLYSSLFNIDLPHVKSWEDHSERVSHKLSQLIGQDPEIGPLQSIVYGIEELFEGKRAKVYSPEDQLLYARVSSITHLVRRMVQGNQNFPVERFGEVIDMCVESITNLDPNITPRKAKRFIRRELREIWDPYCRSAEALRLVGAPTRATAYRIGQRLVSLAAYRPSST